MAHSEIRIEGARVNNLKNLSVAFPHGHLVVITGVSGSGKSSLAFDTLYAEGQRRYVESLSSYARQFLGKLNKPEVDDIKGLAPAIAIQQKVISRNPRSTVGTVTEIHDYIKVLFARVGKTYSPTTGNEVKRHQVIDALNALNTKKDSSRALILCPVDFKDRTAPEMVKLLSQQGYARILLNQEELLRLEDCPPKTIAFELVVDRVAGGTRGEDDTARATDSIQTAFFEGRGTCILQWEDGRREVFSNRFSDGTVEFEEPSPALFSFNTPQGACPTCEGFGSVLGIDRDLVIPNPKLSIYEDAIAPWKSERLSEWKDQLVLGAEAAGLPIHAPVAKLTLEQSKMLWEGCPHFEGIDTFFKYVESKAYKIQYRVLQARYRGKTLCHDCHGSRLRKETDYVKIAGISLGEMARWSIRDARQWFDQLVLPGQDAQIGERLLTEIRRRLEVLERVGLHYLTLDRSAATLSGGESQRIHLATSLGASLVGSVYILDEPSIGLHAKDADDLLSVLIALRDQGNTVVVVEHDALFMRAADTLIDIGPGAGRHGGEVVYVGPGKDIAKTSSLTADYLTGKRFISRDIEDLQGAKWIHLKGGRLNNLQSVDISIPLQRFTTVCGVSGSGKTSLIRNILVPALQKNLGEYSLKGGYYDSLEGDLRQIRAVEVVDQNPIGKSSRSNPVTYLKAYDDIRALFAHQKNAQLRGFQAKHFSFNTDGGRCDVCKGDGYVTVEMQFMADVHLVCEQCNGKRFQEDVLEVEVHGKNISDILTMTIEEAIQFFTDINQVKIAKKIQPLMDVGLGYVHLGQSSSSLSGGEGQRVKLASFLAKGQAADPVFFVFDEPTTGLHFDDVQKLLNAFNALIALGHTVLVIEHQTDVISCADWVIELGPGGGSEGGHIVYQGISNEIFSADQSETAHYLTKWT
jgi:excinuclease ABC subunit A